LNKIFIYKVDVSLNGSEFGDENIIVGDLPFKSALVSYNRDILFMDFLLSFFPDIRKFPRRIC